MKERPFQTYLTRYFHDGSWWGLDITAYDQADAEARCRKLGLQLDGEIIARIPTGPTVGWIARAVCWVGNLIFAP